MKLKKTTSLLLAVLLTAGLMSACQKQDTPAPSASGAAPNTAPATKAEIVVTPQLAGNPNGSIELVWQPNSAHSLASTAKGRVEHLTKRIGEWCEQNPDVKITIVAPSGNNQENAAKLIMQADQGRAPDFAAIDSFMLPKFYDYLQPIDAEMAKQGLQLSDWFPFAQAGMKPGNDTVALWYTTDVRTLYYRKDLIAQDRVPKTWDELIALGKELTAAGQVAYIYPAGRNEAVVTNHLPFLWAQGGDLVNAQGEPAFGEGANREAMINWFGFFKETIDTGVTPQRVATFDKDAALISEMASGQVAMALGSNALVPQMREVIGTEAFDATWGTAPIPLMTAGNEVTTAGGYVTGFFTKDPAKLALAVDFINYIYVGDEGMTGWCINGGYLPARETVYTLDPYFSADPYMLSFKDALKTARTRPAVDCYAAISEELQVQIGKVVSGESLPEQAVDDAWKNVTSK